MSKPKAKPSNKMTGRNVVSVIPSIRFQSLIAQTEPSSATLAESESRKHDQMSLDKDFKKFVVEKEDKNQKGFKLFVKELQSKAQKFIVENKNHIEIGVDVAKTLTSFAINKTPFALVEGLFSTLNTYALNKSFYAHDFFSEINGWRDLKENNIGFEGIFTSVMKRFPFETYKFDHDPANFCKVVDLGVFKLGYITSAAQEFIFYKFNENNRDAVLDFLVKEKLKDLNTNVISVEFKGVIGAGLNLIPEVTFPIASARADYYSSYIKKCMELGISRSIIFNGPPGTGKTTLAQTIIHNTGLRTLKFRFSPHYNFNIFAFIVRNFGIEAVIIDDFDQIGERDDLFEFLEMLKKETKLVIGLANSLHEFHPALLRPARFDEIKTIDALDLELVQNLLGDLSNKYLHKVKRWPVAYINELVTRSRLQTPQDLEKSYRELNSRVNKAIATIK